jgi:DNA segregation ATPase FtsK/SpoIIIE-like protein
MGLPELLTRIETTFKSGNSSEQDALLASWRKNEIKSVLDKRIYQLIDKKLETEYSKTRSPSLNMDKTVIAAGPTNVGPGYVLNGRFILEEVLGSGGMGIVFRAIDLRKKEAQDRDPNIAIKVLSEDFRKHPDALKALQREARKAQSLAHPNIITVYDFDRENNLIYLTMEYLLGSSLEKKMKAQKPPLPMSQVISIVKSVGAALAYAHESGIVHSDLKPANIFITDSGRVKVIDFGIARALKQGDQSDRTEQTAFDVGQLHALTPAYASVDMIEGRDPDVRDDIFGLACITYELVAGRHPFGRVMATDALAEGLVPKKPRSLTGAQWRALSAGLSLERDTRTASVNQFVDHFTSSRKSPLLVPALSAAGVLVAAIATGAYFVLEPGDHPARTADHGVLGDAANDGQAAEAEAARQAAEAAKKEAEHRAAADAAERESQRKAADAAKKEAERQTAIEAEKREAERQAAESAKKEAERQAAVESAKREAERQAAEAAKKEAERQAAADAAKREADRQSAEAAKKEAERQAAADAAKREADRQAEEAAKKEADRQAAADAAKREADRQAAEAVKKEAARQAALESAKREADRHAAEAAKRENDRQAAEAAKKEAARQAAEAARKRAEQQAADAVKGPEPSPTTDRQVAALSPPKLPPLTAASLQGTWCAGTLRIQLTPTEWLFSLPDGHDLQLPVREYQVSGDKILLYSRDGHGQEIVTEFGAISNNEITQIRGKLRDSQSWNSYNRVFKRC